MLYFIVLHDKTGKATASFARASAATAVCRNDWRTFEAAKEIAAAASNETVEYIAIDNGASVSPRYDVIRMHKVGDPVSYGFNGDCYPCGAIKRISASKRVIVTTEGQKFYRRGESGSWKYQSTWSLVRGHVSTTNPEF